MYREKLPSLGDQLASLLSSKFLWYVFSGNTLWALNRSLFNFLIGMFYTETSYLWFSAAEFTNVIITGWFFFTIFFRPNSSGIIPLERVRKVRFEQKRMILMFVFVFSIRIMVYQAVIAYEASHSVGVLMQSPYLWKNSILFFFLAALVSGVALWKITRQHRASAPLTPSNPLVLAYGAQPTVTKLSKNLSPHEIQELARLVYENQKIERITIISLAKIVAGGLLGSLLFEVIVEIVRRL